MDYLQLKELARAGKMVSMKNEKLPVGQNTTAAAFIGRPSCSRILPN